MPAYLLMLKNTNVSKNHDFIKDIFTFIVLAGAVIIIAGYLGIWLTNMFFPGSGEHVSMIMLSIMVFISIANYIIVAIRYEKEKMYFYVSGIILVILYIFFAVTNYDVPVYNLIKIFYEIDYVPYKYWLIIIPMSILGSFTLYYVQKVREKIFKIA